MKRLIALICIFSLLAACSQPLEEEIPSSSSIAPSSSQSSATSSTSSPSSAASSAPSQPLPDEPAEVAGYDDYKTMIREQYQDSLTLLDNDIPISWEDDFVIRTERVDKAHLISGQETECVLFSIDRTYWVLGMLFDSPLFFRIADSTGDIYDLFYCDIDGDGLDEVITHFPTLSLGYASAIYRLEEEELVPMMSTTGDIFATEEDQIGWVEPGFELTVLDGFRFEMAQPLTGFRQTYDVSGMDGELRKIFYREDGEVNENHPLYYEYFQKDIPYPNGNRAYEYLSFEPVDCDGDGVYEIAVGKQFILDIQLTITIGEEVLLLAYNPDTEAFDIQKADFDMQLGNPDGTLAPDWYRMEKASS